MWNLKNNTNECTYKANTNECTYKTETDSQTYKINLWLPKGRGKSGGTK